MAARVKIRNGEDQLPSVLHAADRSLALADLRKFIEIVSARKELEIIEGADSHLEMGALYELSLREPYPPALLFKDIKGYGTGASVLMNVRFARLLVGELNLDAVKAHRARGKREAEPIPPVEVNHGPVLENVLRGEKVDINAFPAPHWHEHDGGRYIGTECLVINKDPDSDWVNIGTYRVQVQDQKTLSVFIEPGKHGSHIRQKYWDRGLPCPMLVSVGQAPVLGIVASGTSPQGVSEYATAGGMIGQPIKVVRGELTGLPIPADAELVFEGYMPPPEEETRAEGPFAEWPEYYASTGDNQPVLRVGAIYHRTNPILIGQPPAKPTFPGRQPTVESMAALWDALENAGAPGVAGVWKMLGGGARLINVISIKQLHPGHAKMAGLVATGARAGAYFGRITIIVDDDIDITNPAEVMWALATRWDPKTQTDIVNGCWTGYIDPVLSPAKRAAGDITGSRIITYAVRPYHWKDNFSKVNTVDKTYAEDVRRKWQDQLTFLRRP